MSKDPHALVLRVLRLQKPAFSSNPATPYSEPSAENEYALAEDDLPLSSMLALPSQLHRYYTVRKAESRCAASFGTCHLGETFQALIAANNESGMDVSDATLRVEVQSSTLKTPLAEVTLSDGQATLKAGDSLRSTIRFEIKEQGQREHTDFHNVLCSYR